LKIKPIFIGKKMSELLLLFKNGQTLGSFLRKLSENKQEAGENIVKILYLEKMLVDFEIDETA